MMENKYYYLADFMSREELSQLRKNYEKFREEAGKYSFSWLPGELEKYAFEKGIITSEQYKKISKTATILM